MPDDDAATAPIADLDTAARARLTSGRNFWTTKPEGEVPSIMLTDGPHGLRKQTGASDHLGLAGSIAATCFPPAVGLAQTWRPDLAERVGAAIGDEARAHDVAVVLGPGINLKRSPLGGRNFEYYSEDPYLTAVLGESWVRGLQSRGVGASVKHFAANNQETDRMRVSADIDERTLHELYLRAFRRIVQRAQPWTVMSSYNRINGVQVSHNPQLLTEILRDRWGFNGAVVSDWGAVVDRVKSIAAGLDLTMPFAGERPDEELANAVAAGELDASALERSATRVAALALRGTPSEPVDAVDFDAHHALAREVAAAGVTLLRNDGDLLPLSGGASISVIGALATAPRYQGGGSSHVNATQVDIPLDIIRERAAADVTFAPGYSLATSNESSSSDSADLIVEAVAAASVADKVLLFLGLDEAQESEGFDRSTMDLPIDQLLLASQVCAANPATVIVLCHGGAVDVALLPAPAILDAALLGQAAGSGIADVIFGEVNPSGRLAETLPLRVEDTPAYLSFPGERGHVPYTEGIYVGYRWFDARDMDVAFPFGHGLSYTTFDYADLTVAATDEGLTVTVAVTNSGEHDGREVVQVYIGVTDADTLRPIARAPRELKGFANVAVAADETVSVTIDIERDDLAYWDIDVDDFVVASGQYTVSVGASSRDIRLVETVTVSGDVVSRPLSLESSIAEVLANPAAAEGMKPITDAMFGGRAKDADAEDASSGTGGALGTDLLSLAGSMPVQRLVGFSGGQLPVEVLQAILDAANAS